MGSELARQEPNGILERAQWANQLAAADLLPQQYRGRPGNLIMAAEMAKSLNLHPMTAITGMYVINGKPCASAALMSALVRRAGHKLRVTGNAFSATATLIRHDDPDFEFTVTWEANKNSNGNPNAEDAGLLHKDTWRQYRPSLLKWRAISQVCRDGAEEALMGMHYTPEEMGAIVNGDGFPIRAEQMERIPPEDIIMMMIEDATVESSLIELHKTALTSGLLATIPKGETMSIKDMLNAKMRQFKAAAAVKDETPEAPATVNLGAEKVDEDEDRVEVVDAEVLTAEEDAALGDRLGVSKEDIH